LTGEIEGIGTKILLMGPLNAAKANMDLLKIIDALKFGEYPFVEIGSDIKSANFSIT
jgi:hypothetical protein